jgi:hypothetical protein
MQCIYSNHEDAAHGAFAAEDRGPGDGTPDAATEPQKDHHHDHHHHGREVMSKLDARSWTIGRGGGIDPEHDESAWQPGDAGRRIWSGDYEGATIIGVRHEGQPRSAASWYARLDDGTTLGPFSCRSAAALASFMQTATTGEPR